MGTAAGPGPEPSNAALRPSSPVPSVRVPVTVRRMRGFRQPGAAAVRGSRAPRHAPGSRHLCRGGVRRRTFRVRGARHAAGSDRTRQPGDRRPGESTGAWRLVAFRSWPIAPSAMSWRRARCSPPLARATAPARGHERKRRRSRRRARQLAFTGDGRVRHSQAPTPSAIATASTLAIAAGCITATIAIASRAICAQGSSRVM
jgi:hypothetical protein